MMDQQSLKRYTVNTLNEYHSHVINRTLLYGTVQYCMTCMTATEIDHVDLIPLIISTMSSKAKLGLSIRLLVRTQVWKLHIA